MSFVLLSSPIATIPCHHLQHKKLNVEGGGITKDFRKGQKQGDLEIWDPVDQVLGEGSEGYGSRLAENMTNVKPCCSKRLV